MLFVPGNGSVGSVDLMFDLGEAVPFARIAEENCLDPQVFEGNEKLLRFRYGNIVIVLAVDDEGRRMRSSDMLQCRAFPCQVHQVSLVQELSKLHLLVLVVVGHVVVANQVRNPGGGNRRLKLVGLRDEPIGQLATVAHALDPHTFPIDP